MALKIWGRMSSINVRKVVLTAQWLGLEFERIDAGHEFGIVKTPEYLAKNPNALIPLVEDGNFRLWESNVIVRYLCARYGAPTLAAEAAALPPEGAAPGSGRPSAPAGKLYPQELQPRFDAERWMDWQQTTLNPAGRNAFVQLIRTPAEKRNAELVAQSVAATEPLLSMLDAHLAKQAFLAGGSMTMADLPIACEMHRWRGLSIEQVARPHLDRWYQGILSNPAARGVLDQPLA